MCVGQPRTRIPANGAHDRGHAAGECGRGLALGVERQIATDPDVEVRVHRARQHEAIARVDDDGRVGGGDRIGPQVAKDDGAVEDGDRRGACAD